MYRNTDKKGSVLVLVIVLISFFSIIASVWVMRYLEAKNRTDDRIRALQASNYTREGIELAKGYLLTRVNQDRISGWRNYVATLNGKYVIRYDNGYIIDPGDTETIEQTDPFSATYVRTTEIRDGSSSDEKVITSTVDYGGKEKVQYTTSVTNIYGK